MGLSLVKKPDCRRRGDGEGGICDKVSIVRSDRDGRDFRVVLSPSITCSTSVFAVAAGVLPDNTVGSGMTS